MKDRVWLGVLTTDEGSSRNRVTAMPRIPSRERARSIAFCVF